MFQNKFEIKILENGRDIILGAKLLYVGKNVIRGIKCSSYRTYL